MSFSSEVKEELSKHINTSRHCQIAELAAIISNFGKVEYSEDEGFKLCLLTENVTVIRKGFTLLKKTFNIDTDIVWRTALENGKDLANVVLLKNKNQIDKVLQAVKMDNHIGINVAHINGVNPLIIKNACCKRAYLRGTFLCIGSMSDPEKS